MVMDTFCLEMLNTYSLSHLTHIFQKDNLDNLHLDMLVPGFDISMINFDFVLIFCRSSLPLLGLNFDLWLMVQFLEIKYKNQLFNNIIT